MEMTVEGTAIASVIATDCPCVIGDVELGKSGSCSFAIDNTGDADTDFSITGNPNVAVTPSSGTIAAGGSASIGVVWTPTVIGELAGDLTIASTCPDAETVCALDGECIPPAAVVLGFDQDEYQTKPEQEDTIQVTIADVSTAYPVYSLYFRVVIDTQLAWFDTNTVFFDPSKTVIDSAGWDIKVHAYPPDWDYPDVDGDGMADSVVCAHGDTSRVVMGMDIWLVGGEPLTTSGCILNLHVVKNSDGIDDLDCYCGGEDCYTCIMFLDAMANEGEPEVIYDATSIMSINDGPVWDEFTLILPDHIPNNVDATGIENGTMNTSEVYVIAREGMVACDGDQYALYYHFGASDDEGDLKQLVHWGVEFGAFGFSAEAMVGRYDDWVDPATLPLGWSFPFNVYTAWTDPFPFDNGVIGPGDPLDPNFPQAEQNDSTGLGWWYHRMIPKPDWTGTWHDTFVVMTTHTTLDPQWGGPQPCYDTLIVEVLVESLHVEANWMGIIGAPGMDFHACGQPEATVQLCVDTDYWPGGWTEMNALDTEKRVYSIDMILDYDCDCLVPYEVGNEGLDTELIGALTYSLDPENCRIAVSIALNEYLENTLGQEPCVPVVYVGFELQPESVSPACTTGHAALLSIDHVKLNEAYPTVCWDDGAITYDDYTLAGWVWYSDNSNWVNNVTITFSDITDGTVLSTVTTGDKTQIPPWADGYYGYGPFFYCPEGYCITPSKEGIPDQVITSLDASEILRVLCNQTTFSHNDSIAADVTCSGPGLIRGNCDVPGKDWHEVYDITAYDAAVLLRWLVGHEVESCIGQWHFEYFGDDVCYHHMPYVCWEDLDDDHLFENFEAVIIGDVTQNYETADGKVVVSTPDVAVKGRTATISMSGDIYAATLELVGVTVRSVTAPEGMLCEWRSADNVTKIAVATGESVVDAALTVELESGERLELYGTVNGIPFATRAEKIAPVPTEFSLAQNYPNPFNPVTSIEYGLPENGHVTVTVYNVLGQVVAELVNSEMSAGYHVVRWDASNAASGVYFYRIDAGDFTATKRMVLMK
jgi:hypothetical protein